MANSDYNPTHEDDTSAQPKEMQNASELTAFQRVSNDQYTRLTYRFNPCVLTLELDEETDTAPNIFLLPPHGSVTLLFGNKTGSTLLQDFENAYSSKHYEHLRQLGKHFHTQSQTDVELSVAEVASQIIRSPVYFDLRYDGKTLASHLALINGHNLNSMLFPYNGGELRNEDFSIVEYYRPGQRTGYEYLLLKRPPYLSVLEKKAVDAVPSHQLELNIASVALRNFPGDILRVIMDQAGRTVGCREDIHERALHLTLPAEVIKKLGSEASARELLNLRQQLLTEFK